MVLSSLLFGWLFHVVRALKKSYSMGLDLFLTRTSFFGSEAAKMFLSVRIFPDTFFGLPLRRINLLYLQKDNNNCFCFLREHSASLCFGNLLIPFFLFSCKDGACLFLVPVFHKWFHLRDARDLLYDLLVLPLWVHCFRSATVLVLLSGRPVQVPIVLVLLHSPDSPFLYAVPWSFVIISLRWLYYNRPSQKCQ